MVRISATSFSAYFNEALDSFINHIICPATFNYVSRVCWLHRCHAYESDVVAIVLLLMCCCFCAVAAVTQLLLLLSVEGGYPYQIWIR
jgi:hypothetical protein